jgi:hypothetical protein
LLVAEALDARSGPLPLAGRAPASHIYPFKWFRALYASMRGSSMRGSPVPVRCAGDRGNRFTFARLFLREC